MKLYFIEHEDGDGTRQDQFVRAHSREAAVGHWRRANDVPSYYEDPDFVWEVPAREGSEGAVPWDQIIETKENPNASHDPEALFQK